MSDYMRRKVPNSRLVLPAAIEDGRVPGFAAALLYGTCGFLLMAVLWLSIAEVRERVVAPGTLIPSASVQALQHLEGGIVDAVLVEEGQIVSAGTPLLRLVPTASSSDLEQLRVRRAALSLERIRIDAFLAGGDPDFGPLSASYPDLARNQRILHERESRHRTLVRETLESRIARQSAELAGLKDEQRILLARSDTLREQLAMRETLLKDGYSSRRDFLSAKADADEARAELVQVEGRLAATREALSEARAALAEAEAKEARTLSERRVEVIREAAEVAASIDKQADKVDRLAVRAPTDGIVQALNVRTRGDIIRAGDIVARLVPVNGDIIAEVRVRPQDVAQISRGHAAEITVTAYDPNVYGVVNGVVDLVSASTFQTEQGDSYYKALIRFAESELAVKATRGQLLPGMVVDASIITGSKSIMRYVLKPVFRSLDRAFSEQ